MARRARLKAKETGADAGHGVAPPDEHEQERDVNDSDANGEKGNVDPK
jgi:hypothetical protein